MYIPRCCLIVKPKCVCSLVTSTRLMSRCEVNIEGHLVTIQLCSTYLELTVWLTDYQYFNSFTNKLKELEKGTYTTVMEWLPIKGARWIRKELFGSVIQSLSCAPGTSIGYWKTQDVGVSMTFGHVPIISRLPSNKGCDRVNDACHRQLIRVLPICDNRRPDYRRSGPRVWKSWQEWSRPQSNVRRNRSFIDRNEHLS